MKTNILEGKNVKLIPAVSSEKMDLPRNPVPGKAGGWDHATPSKFRMIGKVQKNCEARFVVRTTRDDIAIGFVALNNFDWDARSGWLGIGVGDPDNKKKRYTSEAAHLLLQYAFKSLHLNRVNLNLLSCDKHDIRTYEDMGFRYEGTQREAMVSEDERLDIIDLGILRGEWERLNRYPPEETQML